MTRRRFRAVAFSFVVTVTAGALAAGASGAAPKADKHDRAVIRQLLARQLTVPTKADSALLGIAAACSSSKCLKGA